MYRQIELLQAMKEECEKQKKLLHTFETRLAALPSGSLACRKGNYYRITRYQGKILQVPIPAAWPDGKLLINELKEARYIKKSLPILKTNIRCYEQALQKLKIYDCGQILQSLPAAYQDLPVHRLIPEEEIDPFLWQDAVYDSNPLYPENLVYESDGGLLTRSKAEAMIATKLEQEGIPFHYEEKLRIGGKTIYPDFRALRLHDKKPIYWEHFGKMDDPKYAENAMEKLSFYAAQGFRLGDQLILTWETKASPLTFGQINRCIQTYLLPA